MAERKCSACDELRQTSPSLVVNGLTDSNCTSLANDTGLNPRNDHDDCEDLHNLNDCLVGNMETEVKAYDVCDWKKFMKRFIPNVWTTLKGIICAICGLWTHIHKVEDDIDDICALVNQLIQPSAPHYGVLPLAPTDKRVMGTVTTVNGRPSVIMLPNDGTLNPYTKEAQGVGLDLAVQKVDGCGDDTECVKHVWVRPHFYMCKINEDVQDGDVLWYCSKSEFFEKTDVPSEFWTTFTQSTWTWDGNALNDRRNAWIKLTVAPGNMSENYIGLVWRGTTYPNNALGEDMLISPLTSDFRTYHYGC